MTKNWIVKIILTSFLCVFVLWLFVNKSGINTLPIQSEDTVPTMFLPVTLIKERTMFADTYVKMMKERYPQPDDKLGILGYTPFYLKKVVKLSEPYKECLKHPKDAICSVTTNKYETHYMTAFTVVPGLLITPVYLIPLAFNMPITWDNLILLSHISAALVVMLCGVFMYILLRRFFLTRSEDNSKAVLLTSVYLFGTVNFAMVSQSLWQHGFVQLFIIIGLIFLLNGLTKYSKSAFMISGLFLALAVLSRPTAALFAVLLYILIPIAFRRDLPKLIRATAFQALGVLPAAVFFFWYNAKYFGSIANQGYAGQFLNSWLSPFPEGFLGIWASPSKGILIYSPILLYIFFGLYRAVRNKKIENKSIYIISAVIILLHTLLMGKWKHWYGGFSFGYRLASDALPFFILLLVPYITSSFHEKYKKIFYSLFAFSVFVQISGMIFFDGIWHNAYDNGFRDTKWLWSVKDSEAGFNVRRVLVKFGALDRACPKCLPN